MPDTSRATTAPGPATYAPATANPGEPAAPRPGAAAPLLEFFTSVLRHRRLILGIAVPAAVLTGIVSLLRTREYTSASAFVPQSKQQNSALSTLAAQYGVAVGTGDTQGSPAFYVDLITSRAILEQIAARPVGSTTLADLYDVDERAPALRRDKAVKELRKHVGVTLVPRSGIIRVQVSSPDPAASQLINRSLLELVNDFNLNTRRSQAKAERQFAEQRLVRVRDDLRAAENRLEQFYQQNRIYESSPALTFAQTRIVREVELQRQLNATLTQQAEQAKLDEVRDTPVITVLEQPDLPLRPDPRGTVRFTLSALIGGAVLGVLLGLLLDTMRRAVSDAPGDPHELARHRRAFGDELRRPWLLLRRNGVAGGPHAGAP